MVINGFFRGLLFVRNVGEVWCVWLVFVGAGAVIRKGFSRVGALGAREMSLAYLRSISE
jgi:hypothetical protein